jgi:hypothetical protein
MSAGRKSTGINRKAIAKAIAEAMKDDRDSWDFGFPDREELWHDASYDTWARAPFWSTDECAALTLGKDPSQISGLDIYQLCRTAVFGSHLEHIREEILEAQAEKELPERIRPVEFIAWAREKEIGIPAQLEAAVSDNEADVARRPNIGEGKSMEKSSSEVEVRPETGPADYRKWARAPYWSAEECVALHFDKEPVAGKGLPRGAHVLETDLMDRLHREILSAQRNKELPERIRPVEFLDWAKPHWPVPDDLENAISMHYADIAKLQDRCEQLEQRHSALSRENQELRYELDRLRAAADAAPKPEPKEVTPRERSSLLKMVIAMAMTKYGYDPAKRNTAAGDIADEIRERGMELTDDTVRDYLQEAADEELPKQQGDEQSA